MNKLNIENDAAVVTNRALCSESQFHKWERANKSAWANKI